MAVEGPTPTHPTEATTAPDVLTPAPAMLYAQAAEKEKRKREKQERNKLEQEKREQEEKRREHEEWRKASFEEIKQRKAMANALTARGTPEASDERTPFTELNQMLAYKENAVMMEMLLVVFCKFFQALFGTYYLEQINQYENALLSGIAYDEKNRPDEMYHLVDGRLDLDQPIHKEETPTRAEIRANGFVPPPDWVESYEQLYANYLKEMMGPSYLSPDQRELVYATDDSGYKEGHSSGANPGSYFYQRGLGSAHRVKP